MLDASQGRVVTRPREWRRLVLPSGSRQDTDTHLSSVGDAAGAAGEGWGAL